VAADAVKTPNNFKSKGREIAQGAFTELAMLFGVISQFDGDVKWKKDALGLESAYSRAANNCKTSSDSAYKEAKMRSEGLTELLKGGSVELPKVDGPGTWHELLIRPVLMKRLEEAREGGRIAKYTANKGDFKKGKDALLREAQVLLTISEVIKDPGFESANDEAYQKFAQAFQTHCLALIEAVKSDDPDKAQGAFAQVSKACDSCHGDFR
jgi:cytochrome c556